MAFLEAYSFVELRLPHTDEVLRCKALPLKKAVALLRLFQQTRVSDDALADLMEQFPKEVEIASEKFDGLTPAEFASVVGGFFSARRDAAPKGESSGD